MKNLLAFILLLLSFTGRSQNLIKNPNFSLHDTCPTYFSQINWARYWYKPNFPTSDYFHKCGYGVPVNNVGHQAPHDSAMAGIIAWYLAYNYREYLATDIDSLEVGARYKVTIRTSRAESPLYACDGIGVFFYKNGKPDTTDATYTYLTPQVDYTSYGIISDTINWVTLTDTFIADSAYKHLIIGIFKPDGLVNKVLSSPPGTAYGGNFSYYFFDSVAVEKMSVQGADIAVRSRGSITIHPNPSHNTLTISAPYNFTHLSVSDLTGRQMFATDCDNRTLNIDVSSFSKGIYIVRVDESLVYRFVKD